MRSMAARSLGQVLIKHVQCQGLSEYDQKIAEKNRKSWTSRRRFKTMIQASRYCRRRIPLFFKFKIWNCVFWHFMSVEWVLDVQNQSLKKVPRNRRKTLHCTSREFAVLFLCTNPAKSHHNGVEAAGKLTTVYNTFLKCSWFYARGK